MKNKKGLFIFLTIVILLAAGVVVYNVLNKFEYNEDNVTGNTTGNLYNEGLFCQYGDEVYFSNPFDNNALYKMNMEGTEFEKLSDDNASYICIYNNYIYYKKFNSDQNKDKLFQRIRYGIVRMKNGKSGTNMIHEGKIDCMVLVGNYIYYRYYDDETLFSLRKVKIDGKEDELIDEGDYQPIAAYDGKIYLTNVADNRRLMMLDTSDDTIRTIADGDFYMPDVYNRSVYYIDMTDGRKLKRMNMLTREVTVLTEDKVINYNLSGEYGVIYYQAENGTDDHSLCRININGTGRTVISIGNYSKINITEKYTYFYHEIGEAKVIYRTPTVGAVDVEEFSPEVLED